MKYNLDFTIFNELFFNFGKQAFAVSKGEFLLSNEHQGELTNEKIQEVQRELSLAKVRMKAAFNLLKDFRNLNNNASLNLQPPNSYAGEGESGVNVIVIN
jgi:hypothetical protein